MPCQDCDESVIMLPTGPAGPSGNTGGKPMLGTTLITDINTPYIPVTSAGYSTVSTLEYPGSTAIGAVPTRVKVVYNVTSGTTTIRVVDKNSNLIASSTGTSTSKAIMTLTITASAATLTADNYFELQVQTNGSFTCNVYAWTVY